MKFKTEVTLLVIAIILFAVAMFFYSHQGIIGETASIVSADSGYPYRGLALAIVGIGSISMVTASVSYTKKSKNII